MQYQSLEEETDMKLLEERIQRDGIVREGNVLKVDSFINHQMDIPLFKEMAREWHCRCGCQRVQCSCGVCQKVHEHQPGLRQL